MKVRSATAAAPGRPENEDAVFTAGSLVGVLDGVTATDGLDSGCTHSVHWYVQHLVARLIEVHTERPDADLKTTLGHAIGLVREDHGPGCDLSNPGTPAATIALLRQQDTTLDYLVLCDATLALDRSADVHVVTDPRFAQAVADIRARTFASRPAVGTDDHREAVRWAAAERQKLTNQEGGYWIAAADPAVAQHAVAGTTDIATVHRAALMTDGAANLVDRFGELDWHALLDLADTKGPAEVIHAVRAAERKDPNAHKKPRYKRHDDATIAICTFEEARP